MGYYLTGVFRLRANTHDRALLQVARSRWTAACHEALDRARAHQKDLLGCLKLWTSKDGHHTKIVVDKKELHKQVLLYCQPVETHLHNSTRMSLIVTIEEQLGSWLGLYSEWVNGKRQSPKPSFPSLPPATEKIGQQRYEAALAEASYVTSLAEEDLWRANVTREAKGKLMPVYFGAATSGGKDGQAHCGLLKRADGRYFALLTLFGQGDSRGEAVTRAANRQKRGDVYNVRSAVEFRPSEKARASMMVPLMMGRGHEHLFLGRAQPKSAELVYKNKEYYLHVAFEFPDHALREKTSNILAVRRGITTLVAAMVVSPEGQVMRREVVEGKQLAALISNIKKLRAKRQQRGKTLIGDRRAARIVDHHLYSVAHQLIDIACQTGAEIVLLKDPRARKPQRFLAYKHFSELERLLTYLCLEAGLAAPQVRGIYGKHLTCVACGWAPGDRVRYEEVKTGECPGCRRVRDEQWDQAELLGLDVLRFREHPKKEKRPMLGELVREKRS